MFDGFFETAEDLLTELKDPYLWRSYQSLKSLYERHKNSADQMKITTLLLEESDQLLAYLWERIHDGKWLNIHPTYRYFYGNLCAIVGYYSWITNSNGNKIHDVTFISRQFRLLDLGLLLGSPESFDLLHHIISVIQSSSPVTLPLASLAHISSPEVLRRSTLPISLPQLRQSIPVESCPDILRFSNQYFSRNQPVILKNCIQDWPALSLWADLHYINSGGL